MTFENANAIPAGSVLRCDVCIVGSGAAGIALASRLSNSGQRVIVLEAGGARTPDSDNDESFEVDYVGTPRRNPIPNRSRSFGGSTNLWFGRVALPDPIDFEPRPWVPYSGWPISYGAIAQWFPWAARLLDVRRFEMMDLGRWPTNSTIRTFARPGSSDLKVFLWSKQTATGLVHRKALRLAPNVRVLLNATAVELLPVQEGHAIGSLTVGATSNRRFAISAQTYVLAAGGIENPRLLLASTAASPLGVGNQNDLVGRFYMDHPRDEDQARVTLRGLSREQLRRVELLGERTRSAFGRTQLRLTFPPEVQRERQLLNHSLHAHLVTDMHGLRGYQGARRIADRLLGRGGGGESRMRSELCAAVLDSHRLAVHGIQSLTRTTRPTELIVVDQMEQEPDPNSRLVVDTDKRDRFGIPKVRVDWRIGDSTLHSQREMHALFDRILRSVGINSLRSGLLTSPDVQPEYLDMKHPSGTTRMGASPETGVVDRDLRVFGVGNLYVVGSSVFPTVGHANPTLLIVALAARLADHLTKR